MLTVMTELDAINFMLSAIGSDPINNAEDTTDIDVDNAKRILENVLGVFKDKVGILIPKKCCLKP